MEILENMNKEHTVQMGGDSLAENTSNVPKFFGQICLPKPKISGFSKKKLPHTKCLQLPLRQWGAGNVNVLLLSSWKVNIAENPAAVIGL